VSIAKLKCTKLSTAAELHWNNFKKLKPNQGVDNLLPTQGAMIKMVFRAHLRCSVWKQALLIQPKMLDATKLGWMHENLEYVPILSSMPPHPDSVTKLVRCGCDKTQCSGNCNCKRNKVVCISICRCEADEDICRNVETYDESEDIQYEY